MRKIIAAINMTLDGICDHDSIVPDAEIHQHYSDLLDQADVILYGRTTYQLMQFWQTLLEKPSGEKSMDEFAVAIDQIQKIVFSHTLTDAGWESASLADNSLEEVAGALKMQPGRNILVGSRSLIIQLLDLNLIDEFQLCIHPVIKRTGMPLFENMAHEAIFKLIKTKVFAGGAVAHYYEPVRHHEAADFAGQEPEV